MAEQRMTAAERQAQGAAVARRAAPARTTTVVSKRLEGNAIGTVGLMLAGMAFMFSWFPETARFAVPGGALGALLGVVGAVIMLSGYSKDVTASTAAVFVGVVALVIGSQVVSKAENAGASINMNISTSGQPGTNSDSSRPAGAKTMPVRITFSRIEEKPTSKEVIFTFTNTGSQGITGVQGAIRTFDQFGDTDRPDLRFECDQSIPAGGSIEYRGRWMALSPKDYEVIGGGKARFDLVKYDIRFADGSIQSGGE